MTAVCESYPEAKNVTLIASGKGGVGKTWISINFAEILAEVTGKILLFDGDLGLSNVDIQLGQIPARDLQHYFQGVLPLRGIIQKDYSFSTISGRSGVFQLSELGISEIVKMCSELELLSPDYDETLIDLPAGIGTSLRPFFSIADRVVLIVTNEPTSITDAYAFLKFLSVVRPVIPVWFVANQVIDETEGKQVFNIFQRACHRFLRRGTNYAGFIPWDQNVNRAIREQESFTKRFPHSDVTNQIRKIIRKIFKADSVAASF